MRHGKGHCEHSSSNDCVEKIYNAAEPAGLADCASDIVFMVAWWTSAMWSEEMSAAVELDLTPSAPMGGIGAGSGIVLG
jgi:hypothetical protein